MDSMVRIQGIIREKFRFGTLSFLFIIAYVNIFQLIFGPENTIAGVIFTIMMSASMARDLTATPIRHLIIQAVALACIAVAACFVSVLPAPWSFLLNFITILLILYAYTYEYSSHLYFPYILSYLFLVFISPADIGQLPKRVVCMLFGAASIILYQWVMGRKRVMRTARDVLSDMTEEIRSLIAQKLDGPTREPDASGIRHKLCLLSQTVYERRKKALCISDAGFSMIAAGRGLEHLFLLIHELPQELTEKERGLLINVDGQLEGCRAFLHQESTVFPELNPPSSFEALNDKESYLFYRTLAYTQDRLLHMADPEKRQRYRQTALSLKVRLQTAIDLSPVRAVYALRVALLLSCATCLVQYLELPHGRWLLFTLASVSLPYADDVPVKMKKRILATIIGGLISVAVYSLVPSAAGRTAAMMVSGYLSFYFTDYAQTFACSTVGAMGGAVFMDAFGFQAVGSIFIIRLGYIFAGIAAAFVVNCLICPYTRKKATVKLWEKYQYISELLERVCHAGDEDPQLYYNLVIQAHLLEEKLIQNAHLEEWERFPELLEECQSRVRLAHRTRVPGRLS